MKKKYQKINKNCNSKNNKYKLLIIEDLLKIILLQLIIIFMSIQIKSICRKKSIYKAIKEIN